MHYVGGKGEVCGSCEGGVAGYFCHSPVRSNLIYHVPTRLPIALPHPSQLLLAPLSQPGACLPLVGPSGWVDIRLALPIRPTGAC